MQFGLSALLLRCVGKTRAELRLQSTIPSPERSPSFQAPQTPENCEVFLLAGTRITHDLVWVSGSAPSDICSGPLPALPVSSPM